MEKNFHIAGLCVAAGCKLQTSLTIPNTLTELPITVINGVKEGKTVVLTAGIHACEYPAIFTAINIAQELQPQDIAGQLVIVHLANPQAFGEYMPRIVPEDGKNLNRVFPGRQTGTLSEKIAHFLMNNIIEEADFYVDMHGGDQQEYLLPYVYYQGNAASSVAKQSRMAAKHINVDYMVASKSTGGAYNEAALAGVPSILIERGGMGECRSADVAAYRSDIINLLRYWEILPGTATEFTPRETERVIYLSTAETGCCQMAVQPGDSIKKGQLLGTVYDLFGSELKRYYAAEDGIVLYCWGALAVNKGECIIAYAVFS